MDIRDRIGKRGENIFAQIITRWCGGEDWFEEERLGGKTEVVDFLVNLLDPADGRPQFYVQIKSTSKGYSGAGTSERLKVNVSLEDILEMKKFSIPAYIVGIDIHAEKAFIVGVGPLTNAMNGLPTSHPLDCASFETLWDEVQAIYSNQRKKDSTVFGT